MARNLRPEKEYMFRVYAENKYGPSEHTLPATLPSREGEEMDHVGLCCCCHHVQW